MSILTFDTLRFTRTLEKAGLTPEQAEAISTAFKDASGEAQVATKRDIEKLDYKLDRLSDTVDRENSLSRWMLTALIALAAANFAKQYF